MFAKLGRRGPFDLALSFGMQPVELAGCGLYGASKHFSATHLAKAGVVAEQEVNVVLSPVLATVVHALPPASGVDGCGHHGPEEAHRRHGQPEDRLVAVEGNEATQHHRLRGWGRAPAKSKTLPAARQCSSFFGD